MPERDRAPGGSVQGVELGAVIEAGRHDTPPIGAEIAGTGIRWEALHALFLRLIAALWMLKGIGFWALILGLGELPLGEETPIRQVAIVASALVDCSAAVGLWLLSPWGKSLWVLAACAELALGLSGLEGTASLASPTAAGLTLFFFAVLAFAARRRQLGLF